ncbi:MAG: quinone oxidoreductase family protein [Halobacteriota archaeon]
MRCVEATGYGGPDVLEPAERERPTPDEGEVLVQVEAAGVNFADVMQRRGLYPGGPEPPYVPGLEVAGTVVEAGDDVDHDEGERVVAMVDGAGYAEYAVADVRTLFDVPETLSWEEAAGVPVQYLTAHGCLHAWGGLEAGERVLIHAAAGGVGTAAVQLASAADAEVYGTASTDEKLALARELGADHAINYEEESFSDRVNELTDGEGVDLVLDGVGGDAFEDSFDCLAEFGRVVAYGVASGVVPSVSTPDLLFSNHSVHGYHLGRAAAVEPERVAAAVPEVQAMLESGEVHVVVGGTYDLDEASEVHRALENRETTGKLVLKP